MTGGPEKSLNFSTSLVILTLAVQFVAASSDGQNEAPEARELARLMFTSGLFDVVMIQAGGAATKVVKAGMEGRLGRPLSEDEARRLEALITRAVQDTVPKADFEALYAGLLSRHLSSQELKDLAAFYRTPLGAKALRLSAILTREGAAGGERIMKLHERAFVERFGAEFTRELPALEKELEQRR